MDHQNIDIKIWIRKYRLDLGFHSSTEPEDQVEGALLLDVVVREGPSILQLLSGKDQPLLIRRDSFLVLKRKSSKMIRNVITYHSHLDLGFDVFDRVAGFNLQGDGLASESLHEDLHSAAKPEDQVESALLLDVVIRKGSAILQLLPSENQPLLVGGDPFLVLRTEISPCRQEKE